MEYIPQNQIEIILNSLRDIQFATTNNRCVLGSLNEFMFQLRYMIAERGGLDFTDLAELNYELNRIPINTRNMFFLLRNSGLFLIN